MRPVLAVGAALLAALALPGTALGHAHLSGASPGTQSTVAAPPTEIRLRFNQAVTVTSRAIEVLAPDGTVLSGTSKVVEGGRLVVAPEIGRAHV